MTERAATNLPAESRIVSRVEGDDFVITIPGGRRGRTGLGWSAGAAFLGLTFTTQGLLTHRAEWSAAGLASFLFAMVMSLKSVKMLVRNQQRIKLRISPASLALEYSEGRRLWKLNDIGRVHAEDGDLNLYQTGGGPVVKLAGGLMQGEGEWVGEQIQRYLEKRITNN